MEVFNTSFGNRETYKVEVKSSLLFEAALGIAAITNEALRTTLNKDVVKDSSAISETLTKELEIVQTHNTWKTLLQLTHETSAESLEDWIDFVEKLCNVELRRIAIPFVGNQWEEKRKEAAHGSEKAKRELIKWTKEHAFFPAYIQYICESDTETLKRHLITVLTKWWKEVIEPQTEWTSEVLRRDAESKRKAQGHMHPEAFVEWATQGRAYPPEPSVHQVLLIPQYVYRPWNVEADLSGVKVLYYPVSKSSIDPLTEDEPNEQLVQQYKALGDMTRMRMLKKLSARSMSLKELTDVFGMGKTTVHHHLKLLKAARILKQEGQHYSVNQVVVSEMGKELERFLET
ncbi:winged helix-turn-helix transcriptional regulator [Halobacillus locisalis]|uniref:Winged helix-turn-helix transcriptional regulator n=1 Tax=Halobacillus locisalis TaxID=220753 RepID=A0A838CPF1_9BACI|nr:metalloregulator ArsR/SmtB family transcription factor [Halobacillus locisalis]MBA2173728.1 winged helix-turn-helix transcriptional regulator [Halobacillus locisalis]